MSDDAGDVVARRRFEIKNRLGLHARAASQIVQALAEFDAEIRIKKEGQDVDAKSILGLLMLAAGPGCEIEVVAQGPDAGPAVDALEALIEARFNED